MGFVHDGKPDIFVSYAHMNDQLVTSHGDKAGWVTKFVHDLKGMLGQLLGRADFFELWSDEQLKGNEPLTPEIIRQLKDAAVLVVILSPASLASHWCKLELKTFLEELPKRKSPTNRIFVVEYSPVKTKPVELKDLPGYRFYEKATKKNGPTETLGSRCRPVGDPAYYQKLNVLSHQMAEALISLKEIECDDGSGENEQTLTNRSKTGTTRSPTTSPAPKPDEKERREQHRERVERLLKQLKPEVLKQLAKELRAPKEPVCQAGADPIPYIFPKLFEPQRLVTIAGLDTVHSTLEKEGDSKQADIIFEIFEESAPLLIDEVTAKELWAEIHVYKTGFYFAPDDDPTKLALLVAKTDGKSVKYEAPVAKDPDASYSAINSLKTPRKHPLEAPVTPQTLAISILVDLYAGQSEGESPGINRDMKQLARELGGILMKHGRGESAERTLYCIHQLPPDGKDYSQHTAALALIKNELNELKRVNPIFWRDLPDFIFLALSRKSDLDCPTFNILSILRTRFKRERNRDGHAPSE